ncbi:MAG TPA: ribosome biogenesis GTP-binding protein YihA/YsxC [Bacteroidales bacterium]|nr:ribosome biogenesis GTP-binding protein YihA/YsxC [Bacteroidales bacterium]HPO66128.1 ribosome biogenesis GTP-binding protein YihA/YsxC [Bacteroidales bacterium]
MITMQAEFVKSTANYQDCPPGNLPEFAFIGRSNVGKSSLINMLVNQKHLAHTSAKPGKTQTINHFLINFHPKNKPPQKTVSMYFADLPGYGYAHVSKEKKQQFERMIAGYVLTRKNLLTLFVLIDSRLDPQPNDMGFIQFLGENQVPFALIFTKADKLSTSRLTRNIEQFKNQMLETWEELPPVFITSAIKHTGREEILQYITECIDKYWKR